MTDAQKKARLAQIKSDLEVNDEKIDYIEDSIGALQGRKAKIEEANKKLYDEALKIAGCNCFVMGLDCPHS